MFDAVTKTDLPLEVFNKGKVRDTYKVENKLLQIITDRISAFDFKVPTGIEYKGFCLTQLTDFWNNFFEKKDVVKSSIITTDVNEYYPDLKDYSKILKGRSMLVKEAEVFPIECIVRGYISGSAWKSYKKDNTVCRIKLPSGMQESEKFDEPLFTPSTKAEEGQHDENISFEKMVEIIGPDDAEQLKRISLRIYNEGAAYAKDRGIIIADTKFEYGKIEDEIYIVDEVLTPDSSRFWPVNDYESGRPQNSFDKQFVRDYLDGLVEKGLWDKKSTPPGLPRDVSLQTTLKYIQAHDLITGKSLIHKVA
ncbi:MAG: phosphoribosylaminoimidazolesuccinocarboxamide synthase [Candidatus Aenigmarchaeota archaeon]|nr:phosphoribosylaminoimidazolesuccinocarboxamide synthase [Candidatus Aenigmarchaeota archaeon]